MSQPTPPPPSDNAAANPAATTGSEAAVYFSADDPVRVTHVEVQSKTEHPRPVRVRRAPSSVSDASPRKPSLPSDLGDDSDRMGSSVSAPQIEPISMEEIEERLQQLGGKVNPFAQPDEDADDDELFESRMLTDIEISSSDRMLTRPHVINRMLAPVFAAKTVEEVHAGMYQANEVRYATILAQAHACKSDC